MLCTPTGWRKIKNRITLANVFGHKNVNGAGKYRWLRSDTIRHGVSCRCRCAAQSARFEPGAVYVATSRVVDLRPNVCDSHRIRALSTSEFASQDGTPRLCVCCTWCICSCRRSEYSRTNGRNRQPTLARIGARNLADPSRTVCVCGRIGCSCRACPSAIERQCQPFLTVWPNVARRRSRNAL